MFALWYPIKAGASRSGCTRRCSDSGLRKLLLLELSVRPADSPLGLNGSGLVIANPPWQFDGEIVTALEELHPALDAEAAAASRRVAGAGVSG